MPQAKLKSDNINEYKNKRYDRVIKERSKVLELSSNKRAS